MDRMMTYGNTPERIPSLKDVLSYELDMEEELEGWFQEEPFPLIPKDSLVGDEHWWWYR
jgi:hypothetical protein